MTLALTCATCGDGVPPPADAGDDLADVVEWVDSLVLEENRDVINVLYHTAVDPRDGFLIADHAESQIRRYDPSGALVWVTGGKGEGPQEFRNLIAAKRLPSGRVIAVDRSEKIAVFGEAGDTLLATMRVSLLYIEDLDVMADSVILLTGVAEAGRAGPRLHWVSTTSGAITASTFAPYPQSPNPVLSSAVGWVRADVRADSIAAVFATSDTVYVFDSVGRNVDKLPLPSPSYRRVQETSDRPANAPRARAEWLSRFNYMADVFWLTGDVLLVQYMSLLPGQALGRRWHLLGMTRTGQKLFEINGTPQLRAVDRKKGVLVFQDPEREEPNRWRFGILKETGS